MNNSVTVASTYTIDDGNNDASAWATGVAYNVGDLVTYNNNTYMCRQSHTSLSGWDPLSVPALWLLQ